MTSPAPRRVISLLPAATEIVAALGAWEVLVGVSHECDYPAAARELPAVTASRIPHGSSDEIDHAVRALASSGQDLFELDRVRIGDLGPNLIITQRLCDVCAVSEGDVRQLASTLPGGCDVLSLGATTLGDVLTSIAEVARAIGAGDEGDELLAGLRYQLAQIDRAVASARLSHPRVAVIEWTTPLFQAGHWVPDLVHRAGGVDALATSGMHSTVTTAEQIRLAAPDVLIFAPCGMDLAGAAREGATVLARPEWAWATSLPSWAVDGNALTSRPGPRLCTAGVATFVRILHPQFGAPRSEHARWLGPASRV